MREPDFVIAFAQPGYLAFGLALVITAFSLRLVYRPNMRFLTRL